MRAIFQKKCKKKKKKKKKKDKKIKKGQNIWKFGQECTKGENILKKSRWLRTIIARNKLLGKTLLVKLLTQRFLLLLLRIKVT